MEKTWTPLMQVMSDCRLKQKDIKGEGLQNISRLIRGTMSLTPSTSIKLRDKIIKLATKKGTLPDYEITSELLLGQTAFITFELTKRLKECKGDKNPVLKEINEKITGLNNEETIKLLYQTIDVLIKDNQKYIYVDSIEKYCLVLLQLNLDKSTLVDTYNNLIVVHCLKGDYKSVISLYRLVESHVLDLNNLYKTSCFYGNIATAYYYLHMFPQCEYMLKKVSKFESIEKEIFFMTIDAACKSMNSRYKDAEKIYKLALTKCNSINHKDYIINIYTSLADVYLNLNNDEAAIESINNAISLINNTISSKICYNVYLNLLLLRITQNNKSEVVRAFNLAYGEASKLNNPSYPRRVLMELINYYKNNNYIEEIFELSRDSKIILDDDISMIIIKIISKNDTLTNILSTLKNR